jgi:hypothetical protein
MMTKFHGKYDSYRLKCPRGKMGLVFEPCEHAKLHAKFLWCTNPAGICKKEQQKTQLQPCQLCVKMQELVGHQCLNCPHGKEVERA